MARAVAVAHARRPLAVELTTDHAFARRVMRLARTSVVALGLMLALWATTLDTHSAIGFGLATGWVTMPVILWISVRRPALRPGLLIPSTAVTAALVAICLSALPADPAARAGWLLLTVGVLMGSAMGAWFWMRWFPVPAVLHEPFSAGRITLIAVHVSLVIAGFALIGLPALWSAARAASV